jgi:hypothetical protein
MVTVTTAAIDAADRQVVNNVGTPGLNNSTVDRLGSQPVGDKVNKLGIRLIMLWKTALSD